MTTKRMWNTVRVASASSALLLVATLVPVLPATAQSTDQAVEKCAVTAKERLSKVEIASFNESVSAIINDYYKCVRAAQTQVTPPSSTPPGSGRQESGTTSEEEETVEGLIREKAKSIGGSLSTPFLDEISRHHRYRLKRMKLFERCLQSSVFTDEEREKIRKYLEEWPRFQRRQLSDSVTAAKSIESLQGIFGHYTAGQSRNWSRILAGFCMVDTGTRQIDRLERLFHNARSSNPTAFGRLNKPISEARVKLLAAKNLLLKAMETTDAETATKAIDEAYVQIREAYKLIRTAVGLGMKGIHRGECKPGVMSNPTATSLCLISR